MRKFLSFFFGVIVVLFAAHGAVVRADIAPPRRVAAGTQPVPKRSVEEDSDRWIEDGVGRELEVSPGRRLPVFPDAEVDVAMESETVTVDLFPTVIIVEASFTMVAGQFGEPGLVIGFPQSVPTFKGKANDGRLDPPARSLMSKMARSGGRGFPLERFEAEVDDEAVDVTFTRPSALGLYEGWWSWTSDFAPGQTRTIVVRYVQALGADFYSGSTGHARFDATYVLRTGSLWRGPIGSADLLVRLHGIDPADVDVALQSPHRSKQPDEKAALVAPIAEGAQVHWHAENFEPAQDIGISFERSIEEIRSEATLSEPSYGAQLPQDLRTFDRLARLARGLHEDGVEEWAMTEAEEEQLEDLFDELLAQLRDDATGDDPHAREFALRALRRIRFEEECSAEWMQAGELSRCEKAHAWLSVDGIDTLDPSGDDHSHLVDVALDDIVWGFERAAERAVQKRSGRLFWTLVAALSLLLLAWLVRGGQPARRAALLIAAGALVVIPMFGLCALIVFLGVADHLGDEGLFVVFVAPAVVMVGAQLGIVRWRVPVETFGARSKQMLTTAAWAAGACVLITGTWSLLASAIPTLSFVDPDMPVLPWLVSVAAMGMVVGSLAGMPEDRGDGILLASGYMGTQVLLIGVLRHILLDPEMVRAGPIAIQFALLAAASIGAAALQRFQAERSKPPSQPH